LGQVSAIYLDFKLINFDFLSIAFRYRSMGRLY
jgi:hypothetical protein